MYQRAGASSGGGGSKVANGAIVASDWSEQGDGKQNSEVTVSLDFTPKQIYWYAPAATYKSMYCYDETLNPNKFQGFMYSSWANANIGAYSVHGKWNGLKEVANNSFTLCAFDNGYSNTSIYWTAIG